MAMNPRTEELFKHLVLMNAIRNAPPALHAAILNGAPDEELHNHLKAHVQQLHQDMQKSAKGGAVDPKESRARRVLKLANEFQDEGTPSAPGNVAAQPGPAPASRRERDSERTKRVGNIFRSDK